MRILIIEDEPSVSSFIKKGLEENGYNTEQAFDGLTGIRLASQNVYDLILLDIIMPGINGLEVCEKLRKEVGYKNPIIMLTALGTSDDVVTGLNNGADDYIAKPFKFKELLARINALIRRSKSSYDKNDLTINDLHIDLDSKEVKRKGTLIKLTAREFNLLVYLTRNKGKVLSRMDILENVWEINFDLGTNVVDVYMNYLRKKVDKKFGHKLLHTVVGMGYVLKE